MGGRPTKVGGQSHPAHHFGPPSHERNAAAIRFLTVSLISIDLKSTDMLKGMTRFELAYR